MRRNALLEAALAPAAALALLLAPAARAEPLPLDGEEGIMRLADRITDYAGASRLRWVIAAPSRDEADDLLRRLGAAVDPAARPALDGISVRIGSRPVAWIEPRIGEERKGAACNWQVWVYDPDAPTDQAGATALPVGPGDSFPVGRGATYRVGFSGLVQSRLYAFGEADDGTVRDLAKVRDVNIPALPGRTETLVLVKARQPVPHFEEIRQRLEAAPGKVDRLGPEIALLQDQLGRKRGVGSNIQLITPDMISRDIGSLPAEPRQASAETSEDFVETCLFTLRGRP